MKQTAHIRVQISARAFPDVQARSAETLRISVPWKADGLRTVILAEYPAPASSYIALTGRVTFVTILDKPW